MKKQNKKTGFSLLELALATLVISLLLVGVFAGKELVSNAKLKGAQSLTKSSPVTSIPDLVLWLETSMSESITNASESEISDGELVYSWKDISGNNVEITQDNVTYQPKYVEKGINGIPYITTNDGGQGYLTNDNAPISAGNSKYTMIFVYGSNGFTLAQGSIAINGSAVFPYLSTSGTFVFFGLSTSSAVVAPAVSANVHYIDNLVIDHTASPNVYYYRNGSFTGSDTVEGPFNLTNNYFSVGAGVSEVIMYNRNLNPSELKVINNYLSKKYNITLS